MLNAVVKGVEEVSPGLVFLRVLPDAGVPDFIPGQYVALGLPLEQPAGEGKKPKIVKRAYSIGSSPNEKGHVEFYIAIVPDGLLTPRLAQIREGDRIFFAPKVVGAFTAHEVPETDGLILVSTGTGIAPFISMLRSGALWKPNRRIALLHGVRYSRDLAYREELLQYQRIHPEFQYLATVSREDPEWEGPRGYVQQFFFEGEISVQAGKDHLFLCGNPGMVEEIEAWAVERGYRPHSKKNPGDLHLEKYW